MKILNCNVCHDLIGVTPERRSCFCGRSKAVYSKELHKEVYSGPALLLGISDDDLIALKDHLDVNGFYKSEWVVIPTKASTIVKVKDVDKWYAKELRADLTGRKPGATMGTRQRQKPKA